jgi:hypothetical protein
MGRITRSEGAKSFLRRFEVKNGDQKVCLLEHQENGEWKYDRI